MGKKLGKKAMIYGAIAQSLPDLDFVTALWLAPAPNLLVHRGFTHSFLFVLLATTLLSACLARMHPRENIGFSNWFVFIGIAIMIHPLLDACNAYGTGWFAPFLSHRVSFHCLFVADPFFSLSLGVAVLLLLFTRYSDRVRALIAWSGVALSTCYLMLALHNRSIVHHAIRATQNSQISNHRILITPTPLNIWLWFVAVEDSLGYQVAHRSALDRKSETPFIYFPKNYHLKADIKDTITFNLLKRFSQGYYTLDKKGDTLVFNDLRFGQMIGWSNPNAPFVFHYYLNYPDHNKTVMQRGRFANWNPVNTRTLLEKAIHP